VSQELETNNNSSEEEIDDRVTDFLNDLEEFMENEDLVDLKIEQEKIADNTFRIETKEQANFFIKQVLDAKAQIEEIKTTGNDMLTREQSKIERWMEKEINKVQNSIEYMAGLLQSFVEEELAKTNGKKKSVSLPNGSVGFRTQQPKYEYDDKVLLPYLQDNGREDLINYKPSVSHSELKKRGTVKEGQLYLGNEVVPGVTVIPQDPKFEVKE
jgi:phage host-nuclease inhibitor protein Gam